MIMIQYCYTSFIASLVAVRIKLIFHLNSNKKSITDWSLLFLKKMTTRNKRKLAVLNKESCEGHPRSNMAQNSSAPRSQEDYITQVSEEFEGRVAKRLSKEFSRTKNRILGALARLDDFLMNPLLPGFSGTTPEPSRNALNTSQRTNYDDSQNDPHPEADLTQGQDIITLKANSLWLETRLSFVEFKEKHDGF